LEGGERAAMPKVVKLVDLGCADLIVVDDGRAIYQSKDECSVGLDAKEVAKQVDAVADSIKETIYIKGGRLFKDVTEGMEIPS